MPGMRTVRSFGQQKAAMILRGTFDRLKVFPGLKLTVTVLLLEALEFERAEGFERVLVILVPMAPLWQGREVKRRGWGGRGTAPGCSAGGHVLSRRLDSIRDIIHLL